MKKRSYVYIGVLVLLLVYSGYQVVQQNAQNRGWNEDWICSKFAFYSQQDSDNGYDCTLDKCELMNTQENAKVFSCVCTTNNKTVKQICTDELKHRSYDYNTTFNSPSVNQEVKNATR